MEKLDTNIINMNKLPIVKKEYLGEGYFHFFKNNLNGEIKKVETTKDIYTAMTGVDGYKHNPTPEEGWVWTQSAGGVIKVDTPTKELSENEGTVIEDRYWVCLKDENGDLLTFDYSQEDFNNKYLWQ